MKKLHLFCKRSLSLLLAAAISLGAMINLIGFDAAADDIQPAQVIEEINLALAGTPFASSSQAAYPIKNINDGSTASGSRWAHDSWDFRGDGSSVSNQGYVGIDLGSVQTVSRTVLKWETARPRDYIVEVSQDNVRWETVESEFVACEAENNMVIDDLAFSPLKARYIRAFFFEKATSYPVSLFEFEIYAPVNYAQGNQAVASSGSASAVTDGDANTAWTSEGKQDQWISVNLGGKKTIKSVKLDWGENFASEYAVDVSDDGESWTEVYSTVIGVGGKENVNIANPKTPIYAYQKDDRHYVSSSESGDLPNYGSRAFYKPKVLSAQYVRVRPLKGEGESFSINEIEVYSNPWYDFDVAGDKEILPELMLNDGWQLARDPDVDETPAQISSTGYQADEKEWVDATVPGTVLMSFWKAGRLLDRDGNIVTRHPYESDILAYNNSKISREYYNVDYWYRKEVFIPENYDGQRMILNFEGVNWMSEVYVNGQAVGETVGAFKTHEFDVTPMLVPGKTNTIAVNIHIYPTAKPTNNTGYNWDDSESMWAPNFICSNGWDWMPQLPGVNLGIIRNVSLLTANAVEVKAPYVTTDLPLEDEAPYAYADIAVKTDLVNDSSSDVTGTIKGVITPGNITFEKEVVVPAQSTKTVSFDKDSVAELHVLDPKLWWPYGYGEQNLYNVDLSFEIDGVASDSESVTFGIREFDYWWKDEVGNGDDEWNMQISVNGVKILCKGGNWGMPDAMLDWEFDYDTAVRLHVEENFNMIRAWHGTSDFEAFYEACDKYGVLVYDDFWLNGYFCEYSANFMENVKNKVERLRNHASIVIWCGENEAIPPEPLKTLMPRVIAEMDPDTQYVHRSNNNGKDVEPYEFSGGVTYAIEDPKWYFMQAEKSAGFTTEIGATVIPSLESLKKMMDEEDLFPVQLDAPAEVYGKYINYMYQVHDLGGPSDIGNKGIPRFFEEVNRRYGEPQNIEEFVIKSQMINYETNKAMFEAWNNYLFEKCSGILLWMSQSAWPSTVWQTYDKYWDTNAAFFGCKKGSENIHVQYETYKHDVKVINTLPAALENISVLTEIYNMDGTLQYSYNDTLNAQGLKATTVRNLESVLRNNDKLSDVVFIKLTLTDSEHNILSDNFYWKGTAPDNPSSGRDASADYKALNDLDEAEIDASYTMENRDGKTFMTVTLNNNSDIVAVMSRLKVAKGETDDLVLPTYYSDNYFAMLPGETKIVTVEFEDKYLDGEYPVLKIEGFNTAEAELALVSDDPCVLTGVYAPKDITVANAAEKTVSGLNLPKNVKISTDLYSALLAGVEWDVDSVEYDPNSIFEQKLTINGKVILPENVSNPENIALDIQVNVTVSAANITFESDVKYTKPNNSFTITAIVPDYITKLGVANENGSMLTAISKTYVPAELKGYNVWTVVMSMGTKGSRQLSLYVNDSAGNLISADKSVDIIVADVLPAEDIQAAVAAMRAPSEVKANEIFDITVTTSPGTTNIGIFDETTGRALGKVSSSYVDKKGVRVWTVTLKIGSKGIRHFDVKASDIYGNWSTGAKSYDLDIIVK